MENRQKTYPLFAACGLNCGLCPRYHTDGASKCPGCAGESFAAKHPSCGVLSCCLRHGLEYCYLCDEYPCKKYNGADAADSFITHRHQLRDLAKVSKIGLEAYQAELNEKVAILEDLLENNNDGRRKSFFCVALNLLELPDIKDVLRQIAAETKPGHSAKEKAAIAARLFQAMADQRGVSLALRQKEK